MHRVAHTGRNDLRMDIVIHGEHIRNGAHQINARHADVVQTAQERADVRRARARSQKCLVRAEDQRHIALDALCGKHLGRFQALHRHGNLHHHVRMDRRDLTAFRDHARRVLGGGLYLAGDGAVHNGRDLTDDLTEIPPLFCNQAGVRRHAADNAHIVGFFDVLHVCCVDKKLHSTLSLSVLF